MTTRTWEKILSQMRGEVSDQVYETWLRPLRFVTREGAVVFLATPHKFFKQWIEENHLPRLEEIARKELGEDVTVEIVVGGEEESLPPPVTPARYLRSGEYREARERALAGIRFVVNWDLYRAKIASAGSP